MSTFSLSCLNRTVFICDDRNREREKDNNIIRLSNQTRKERDVALKPSREERKSVNQGSISPMFYEQLLGQYSFAKRIQSQTVSTKKLLKTLAYEKAGGKMLLKLTPGFNRKLSGRADRA